MRELLRVVLPCAAALWIGMTLVFSEMRWFRRVPLDQRLVAFSGNSLPSKGATRRTTSITQDILRPAAAQAGERISKVFGINDDLATRLTRAHLDTDVSSYRMRQFSSAAAAFVVCGLFAGAIRPPFLLTALFVLGIPLLVFLLLEQQVVAAASSRQHRIFAELPVFSEQLAMLLGAGYSLGAALNRLAERNGGAIGQDLQVVCDRVRQGLTVNQALLEWAQLTSVAEVHRLVAVLALSSETSDLGRLVSAEAKTIRLESQRRLTELIDKRAQQVWVPVTVATLIPGVTFLAIPFIHALQLFSGS